MTRQELAPVLDRLESMEAEIRRLREEQAVSRLEPWLSKAQLAEKLGVSERWIEKQLAAAPRQRIPNTMIAGRRKFKASAVELWLQEEGR